MKITVPVTIPDYVYLFYQKASEEMQLTAPQELMARILILYAGTLSEEILKNKTDS